VCYPLAPIGCQTAISEACDLILLIVYCVLQGVLAGSAQKLSVIMYHTTFPTHKMSYFLEFPCLIWGLSA